MRRLLLIVPTLAVSLIALVGSAQAVVVDPSHAGQASVAYNPTPRFRVRLQLMPQGLKSMLHSGVAVQVSSNERADGIVTLSISKSAARQAHIRVGRGATVVVGRGTVPGIKNGIMQLHVRLPRATATKLGRLRRLTVTVRLALVAAGRDHLAIDVAGRY